MKIIRKQLTPVSGSGVAQRYDETTGQFQQYIGGSWVDSPGNDPRQQQLTPPIDSGDPRCDAAARMTAYVQDTIDSIIADLTASATTMTIFSGIWLLLGIFGGLWALFAALISEIVAVASAAGYEDLEANFDAALYERMMCYFYDAMSENGVLTAAGLDLVIGDLATESATVQNMTNALFALTGIAIFNGMAAIRTEEGDCSSCPSCEDYYDSLQTGLGPKTYVGTWSLTGGGDQLTPGTQGEWISSGGHAAGGSFRTTARGASNKSGVLVIDFGQDCTGCYVDLWLYPGANINQIYFYAYEDDLTFHNISSSQYGAVGWQHIQGPTNVTLRYLVMLIDCNLTAEALVRLSEVALTFP